MTAGPSRTGPGDAASQGMWLWDALFAVSALVTGGLVAAADDPLSERIPAAALVLGLGAAWLVAGRRLGIAQTPDTRPEVLGYAAAVIAGIVGAVLLVPESTWGLFVVLPQMFWLVRLRLAIAATVVLTPGLPLLAALSSGDPLDMAVRHLGPQALFMTAFGVLVGVWIHRVTDESEERARLIEELGASRAEVAGLSHTAGVAAERQRLAGEIHDTLAQGFTSIVTLLQAAQAEFDADAPAARRHVELAVRSAKENLREARHLVAAQAPDLLAADTLTSAIGRQVGRFADETGVDAGHRVSGVPRRLAAEPEIVLLRAAQELLANVARHADAQAVTVALDYGEPDAVRLTVTDDGAGFDPAAPTEGSFGLAMLRTRVDRLKGDLEIDSTPGRGTRVTVRVPAPVPVPDRGLDGRVIQGAM